MKRSKDSLIKLIPLLLGAFLLLMASPVLTTAEETSDLDFTNGENTSALTDSKTVSVDNGKLNSSVSIFENGKEVFSKDLTAINVDGIEKVMVDDQQYAIIKYRYKGSSNALYFEVLKLKETGAESIYISDIYERSRIDLSENQITLEYPEYNDGDVKVDPSNIVKQTFSITGDKVIKEDKSIKSDELMRSEKKTNRTLSVNQPNPSYTQISKVLTEKAFDANIPPEIVKAIAFQESGWRQYWEIVPERVKDCEIYDGSNVVIGSDCIGIGIMQVSDYRSLPEGPEKEAYINRLKTDIEFNIEEGLKILKDKWNFGGNIIPTVNDNDSLVIENWYFAILAYNGLLPRNNPLEKAYTAYQEDVFQRIEDYSLLDITPFPTYKLNPYQTDSGLMLFDNQNVQMNGPIHPSSQSLAEGDTSYVTTNGLTLRDGPSGNRIGSLNKGTKVSVTGSFVADNARTNHYVWYPVTASSGKSGWVASSYLSPASEYLDVYELEGINRYETSMSIANYGWHWDQPSSVIIGRGDVPIDALTGSILASALDSPLLLTEKDKLTESVEKELDRLNPENVYILGGSEAAISSEVEDTLNAKFGSNNVVRIAGDNRYETAYQVAAEVRKYEQQDKLFITTGDESSSDALAIAPYAGEQGIPVLLSRTDNLDLNIQNYINQYGINEVTIIGGKNAISSEVESELNNLLGAGNVSRVSGNTRYSTSTAIVEEYYDTSLIDELFISQGLKIADALSASPLASKLRAPIILTRTERIPSETHDWLESNIAIKPDPYFLGGPAAIAETTRTQFIETIK
ncbi:cell wall-binding repeat-containing protein [Virgibacillus flavescens]|uniref:cell wall-binding repeat-containing protein n=1 Tax=Virgibacillus flavescens TaxID=1611422 RepID=UPI003D32AE49